jgi:hypothetical protein
MLEALQFLFDKGERVSIWPGDPGVPVSTLPKDLIVERPPGTQVQLQDYMALA